MEHYLLIKQGTIHDAVEKEPYIADILIENGKIKKIAPILEGAMINDAKIIDATELDVYPGFVDAHCHLGLDGYAVEYAGDDFNEIGDAITPELSAIDAVNPQDRAFQLARERRRHLRGNGTGKLECNWRNFLRDQNLWQTH